MHGQSHFNLLQLIHFAVDGITAFSTWPLRAFNVLGSLLAMLAFLYGAELVVEYLINGHDVSGWTTIVTGMFFFSGINLLALGTIGAYIARIFDEVKQRPLYVVKRNIGQKLPEERILSSASMSPSKLCCRAFVDTRSALPVILVAAVWLAATAGIRPLMLADEGRYVGIAWEMLTSGDWLVPRLDGMPFFHKPPLFYWLSALSLSVFGVHELPARAASLLAATFAAAGLYLFIRRYRNSQVATLTVVILLTQPIFYAGAQFANLDMLVAGLISLTVLAGAEAVLRLEKGLPHRPALARMYALAALGVLAKGLIGIVLPAGVLFFWLLWRRSWRLIAAMLWLPGFLLLGLIALPWFFWMQHSYPGFFDYFVVYHHFRRFSETGFNNQLAFWFYIPVIFLATLPWSPWFARVFVTGPDRRRCLDRGGLRSLMVIWLVLIVVFFSSAEFQAAGIHPAGDAASCLPDCRIVFALAGS
jgi:hypothetical protein